jgi:signal transduction histidine kinase
MLEFGHAGSLKDKQLKYIHNVSVSGHHLLNMVNDILDLSKVEAGKLEIQIEAVPVQSLMAELETMVKTLAEKKEIQFKFDVQPGLTFIQADHVRIKQIFFNLLSNAIKFNHDHGFVFVRLFKSNDEQWIVCEIQDTGMGIPKEKMGELFKEFYQVDFSFARQQEGTGLGLALTKRLVDLHKGKIEVESKVGVGSTFTVKLPVRDNLSKLSLENDTQPLSHQLNG